MKMGSARAPNRLLQTRLSYCENKKRTDARWTVFDSEQLTARRIAVPGIDLNGDCAVSGSPLAGQNANEEPSPILFALAS
jgi:hypothetical protein